MIRSYIFCALLAVVSGQKTENRVSGPFVKRYEPTWDSLDARPIPEWYDQAKIGIFVHWGIHSVPSFESELFWNNWKGHNQAEYVQFMKKYPPTFTYQEFVRDFTAEFFDAKAWAALFKKSGAQYVVLTAKTQDGFALWPSKFSYSWNSVDVGPHRDIVGELSTAVKAQNITVGLYHSLYEWFNPIYLDDKANKFNRDTFVVRKVWPEMFELIETYAPHVLWSDGDWEADEDYWESRKFLTWLYNDSPVKEKIVVNDRWGINMTCKHGDFFTCQDRFNPGFLQVHKWENAMTIDKKSWGYRRNANVEDFLTIQELLKVMVETVSCGGNILITIGPTNDGVIPVVFKEKLLDLGKWLSVNGEAIYNTKPWGHQNDTVSKTWYTSRENFIYALTLEWPHNNKLHISAPVSLYDAIRKVELVGFEKKLDYTLTTVGTDKVLEIEFPGRHKVTSDWVFVVKIIT